MSRELDCNTCGETINVVEEPYAHIDPNLYHCPTCREPSGKTVQLTLDGQTIDLVGYRPDMQEIPW